MAKEYTDIGNALFNKGKVDEALEFYQKAVDARKIDVSSNFGAVGVNLDDSRARGPALDQTLTVHHHGAQLDTEILYKLATDGRDAPIEGGGPNRRPAHLLSAAGAQSL